MLWFFLTLIGAFFNATYYMLVKKHVKKVNKYTMAGWVYLITFLMLFLLSYFRGMPELGEAFILYLSLSAIMYIVATIFYYRALEITDLSLATPILSMTPILIILTSFVILGEFPSVLGIVGILLITLGSFMINLTRDQALLRNPFRRLHKERGIIYMFIVLILFSVISNIIKLLIQASDPIFGPGLIYLLSGVFFVVFSFTKDSKSINVFKARLPLFFVMGLFAFLSAVTINTALNMEIVAYVISIKRLSVLISIMYGGLLFKEKKIKSRILAGLIMIFGSVLITLG